MASERGAVAALPGQTSLVEDPHRAAVGEVLTGHEYELGRWVRSLAAGSTRRAYGRAAVDVLAIGDGTLSVEVIARYRDELAAAGRTPSTIRARMAAVRSLAGWLADAGVLTDDEHRAILRVRPPRSRDTERHDSTGDEAPATVPTDPEIERMIAAAARRIEDQPLRGSTARAVVALLAGCGLRSAEARHVQWQDLIESRPSTAARQRRAGRGTPPAHTLRVRRGTKGGATRRVPVPSLALRDLLEHRALLEDRTGPLPDNAPIVPTLPGGAGEAPRPRLPLHPMGAAAVTRILARLAADAGLPRPYGPHALRHAYAHRLDRGGWSIDVIQARLGHTQATTTLRYLQGAGTEGRDPWDSGR